MIEEIQLKSREIDILRLMADGLTNREIAERLFIGFETVRWYAKQIYNKLDVSGRGEAADKARSLGLLNNDISSTPAIATPNYNLPVQLTSFIGREQQIQEITELLNVTRLLTLTGPGGTGKTRLSLRVAEDIVDYFRDGVFFIDLAPVREAKRVASTIAHTLSILESGDEPINEILQRAIGGRRLLLILDNYEHVMDAVGVVSDLLVGAPNIRIIVTSREPLRVSGEQIYLVPPMTIFQAKQKDLSESVALFVERSQAVKPGFQLDDTNKEAVITLCQRLDGMPLAIELAAGLSRFLTPHTILARIENRFQTLTGGPRDMPERQQTLQATIDWSYDLLNEAEKKLFARLAVFQGGRSLEAIEAICGDDSSIDVFAVLRSLVDKSMVRQIEDELGESRFVMLETLHEYARERLAESGELETLQIQHAEYFADLTDYAYPNLLNAQQVYWYRKLNIELENIRSALTWSFSGGDVEVGMRIDNSLNDFWFSEGYHIEGQHWTNQALEHLDTVSPRLQMGVLQVASRMAYVRQQLEDSIPFHRQALDIARQLKDEDKEAWNLFRLALHEYDASKRTQRDFEDAVAKCEESIAIFLKLDNRSEVSQALMVLGMLHEASENFQRSQDIFNEGLAITREIGDRRREAILLSNLARCTVALGDYQQAEHLSQEAFRIFHDLRFRYMTVLQLAETYPIVAHALGYPERATRILGASSALREAMNIRLQPNQLIHAQNIEAKLRQTA